MRWGEFGRLTGGDVDLAAGTLDMRESQFFKARRLPLPSRVLAALHRYLTARHDAGGSPQPPSALLWNEHKSQGYKAVTLEMLLTTVSHHAGLKPASGRLGPRLHDLRHTFVCHRMLAWDHAGVDVEARLPYLATSLGHKALNSTVVYLPGTQALLHPANERFRAVGAHGLHTPEGDLACGPPNPLRNSCTPSSPIG